MLTCIQICVLSHEVSGETNYFLKKSLLDRLLDRYEVVTKLKLGDGKGRLMI